MKYELKFIIAISILCFKEFKINFMMDNVSDNIIKVICAIIKKNDSVLVVQRSETMNLPLVWEFPGGKLEQMESERECIIREIKEELNLDIEPLVRLESHIFHYTTLSIELIPYIARTTGGEIKLTEHRDFLYLSVDELINLNWAEADIPIVHDYIKYAAGNL